ncbi:MAG: chorismate mutase [Clostridia bacterium]|nr:chorismate mutase [Clostridia bacterium]
MENINKSRENINKIDEQISKLFEQRMQEVEAIANYKKERGIPVFDAVREQEHLASSASKISNAKFSGYYVDFLKNVMRISKDYQNALINGMKVVYGGVEGAFAMMAAKKAFPNAEFIPCTDFNEAYKGVEEGKYDAAVLPIENSFAGDVGVVMDLAFSGTLYINQIIDLDVVQNLLAVKGAKLENIKKVISHPQALAQCDEFINKHALEVENFSNTALAAKYVANQNDLTIAAIASEETASLYGLEVLANGINSARNNTTRFAVFTRTQNLPEETDRTGNEHFILLFTTKNEAGALAQTLNIIGAHNFNMRNLKSRPMKELIWSYYFFVEAEGNINTVNGKEMLQELSAVCSRLKLVGTYK